MPEIRYYEVEQVRSVKVAANTEADALAVAEEAFRTNSKTDLIRFPGNRSAAALDVPQIETVHIRRN